MKDELKDIAYVFYINNVDGKIHTCNISNKEELDCNNYTFGKIKKKFWRLDMYLAEEFLNRYADRIIER